ncbi:MAG: 2-oxoglutarate dehydrogenase E1 component, partial [Alphaproteobacteria bacterium]|nr:2-oxoglutarate dehydrogenase E1 component [Alphaproteobacteria bacterium]
MSTAELEGSSFLFGANSAFIEQLYQRYLASPSSVDASWQQFFAELGDDADTVIAEVRGASWAPRTAAEMPVDTFTSDGDGDNFLAGLQRAPQAVGAVSAAQVRQATLDSLRALMLIRNFRVRGHLHAKLDPLGLQQMVSHSELDPHSFGFGDADLDRPIYINYVLGLENATLREILDILNRTYCGSIGVEFMHIMGPGEKAWIQERIEGRGKEISITDHEKRQILRELVEAEGFERFLQMKYTGTKRFGLDGGESLMPLLHSVLIRAS